jgi:shikimate kinase
MVLLTGPKHVGKTAVGRVLARLCTEDFIDLDELVEQQTGKSPRALYKEGPEVFRHAEAAALDTLDAGVHIVAAGGGLIDNGEALELLKRRDMLIVYLDVSAETAWKRISSKPLPPFLDTADPHETHRSLHERRAVAYRGLAHVTVLAEGKDPEQIAADILGKIPRSLFDLSDPSVSITIHS